MHLFGEYPYRPIGFINQLAHISTLHFRAQKPYQIMLFPNERHMPRSLADRTFMESQMFDYVQKNL